MTVTAHCSTCGEVDFDEIQRDLACRTEEDTVIETITVKCSRCGGGTSHEYRMPLNKWLIVNGYRSRSDEK
jgi:hypothetical protein